MSTINNAQELTRREFFERYVIKDSEELAETKPYHTFLVLFVAVEMLGKMLLGETKKDKKGKIRDTESSLAFFEAINDIDALSPYRQFNHNNTNFIYKLRCGMAHRFSPKLNVTLSVGPDKNDLSNGVIGCKDFLEDIKKAWNDVQNRDDLKVNLDEKALFVNNSITGATATSITQNAGV